MPKSPKPIKSFKHKHEKRAHVPSSEEAGYEDANPKVQAAPTVAAFPRNPIVHRGQDPELFWMHKYGGQDNGATEVDIRSLYRHEHIAPEQLIRGLYKVVESEIQQPDFFGINELFGNALEHSELEKIGDYYIHSDGWSNRLIQGDSLLVMTSLLEREGMGGNIQCIYIDPPYGIKYGSNWQIRLNNRTVKDDDDSLSGEPEQIKAFRDTWELGIHSYLSYFRDRLLVAHQLLHETGSCFVQISDENVHLVRSLLDEIFGSDNFVSLITFRKKTMQFGAKLLEGMSDYLLWYSKNKGLCKFRPLHVDQNVQGVPNWTFVTLPTQTDRKLTNDEWSDHKLLPIGAQVFRPVLMRPSGFSQSMVYDVEFKGKIYKPAKGGCWTTTKDGMAKLIAANRVFAAGENLYYKLYQADYPVTSLTNLWSDMSGPKDIRYIVQTFHKVVQRCILMTTDPGDLILDPTSGSGTTAFVAEQWGRRWITIDTSRIAINVTKTRLMTAVLPYYHLHDHETCDVRQGFVYKKVPHTTLGSIANDEQAPEETLYDKPEEDKKRLRVSGPFTVETLQNYEPISPEGLATRRESEEQLAGFEDLVFEHLKSTGIKTGDKTENAIFVRIDRLASSNLHAEGFYNTPDGEKKAYLQIGPKFGTVSKRAVEEAIKECRQKGDAGWLIILGFSFDSAIQSRRETFSMGTFEVTRVRMHDDLLQEGLLKRDKKAASFVTIGEPDIRLHRGKEGMAHIEIAGLDIYDPIKDIVKSRDVHDIAYWMLDDDYDGSNFVVKQVFFCGGDKDEFDAWKKGIDSLAAQSARRRAELTLKIALDDEAFGRIYGHLSHPFKTKAGQRVAVRVISQFGEETTKVLGIS